MPTTKINPSHLLSRIDNVARIARSTKKQVLGLDMTESRGANELLKPVSQEKGVSKWCEKLGIPAFVNEKLRSFEEKHKVVVLFCVERSSHTWGVSHAGSDWDVKFVFCYDVNRYLSVRDTPKQYTKTVFGPRAAPHAHRNARDVVLNLKGEENKCSETDNEERSDDILDVELGGFELMNFGRLLLKNDPNAFEMLMSPIIYHSTPFLERLRPIGEAYVSHLSLAHHYANWSTGTMMNAKKGDAHKFFKKGLKIYGYIIRGLFSSHWLLRQRSVRNITCINYHSQCGKMLSCLTLVCQARGMPLKITDLITDLYGDKQGREEANKKETLRQVWLDKKILSACKQIVSRLRAGKKSDFAGLPNKEDFFSEIETRLQECKAVCVSRQADENSLDNGCLEPDNAATSLDELIKMTIR